MKHEHSNSYIAYQKICDKLGETPIVRSIEACTMRKDPESEGGRNRVFVISTPGIKRDGNEIVQDGWLLDDYRENPVVMWAHSRDSLPIATATWVDVRAYSIPGSKKANKALMSSASFLSANDNPFADQLLGLYDRGVLRATSVSWRPLKTEFIRDEGNDYVTGIRFLENDLLEYSMVPIPADPQALMQSIRSGHVTAAQMDATGLVRSSDGVFYVNGAHPDHVQERLTVDMGNVKQDNTDDTNTTDRGAIQYSIHGDVPMAPQDTKWSGSEARKRLAQWASSDGSGKKDKIDFDKYRKGFVWYDSDAPGSLSSYKGPHHDIVNGKFESVFRGAAAVAQRIQQGAFDVPDGDIDKIKRHISKEYKSFGETPPWDRSVGAMYESVEEKLRCATVDAEREVLLKAAIGFAENLYGEYRLSEQSEPVSIVGIAGVVESERPLSELYEAIVRSGVEEDDSFAIVSAFASAMTANLTALVLASQEANMFRESLGLTQASNDEVMSALEHVQYIHSNSDNKDSGVINDDNTDTIDRFAAFLDKANKKVDNKDRHEVSSLFTQILTAVSDSDSA